MKKETTRQFLAWADDNVHTIEFDVVWFIAGKFLEKYFPAQHSRAMTSHLVEQFLKMRDGRIYSKSLDRRVREFEEVIRRY